MKKILECVCVKCGKLKVSPDDQTPSTAPAARELEGVIKHVRDPKKRLMRVHEICRKKNVCELDDVDEGAEGGPDGMEVDADGNPTGARLKGHGGCGWVQPQIRKEGLKLFLEYKRSKDDQEVRSAFTVHSLHW